MQAPMGHSPSLYFVGCRWRVWATPDPDAVDHVIPLIRKGSNIEAPVDVYMEPTWDHGLLNLAVYPFPVYERHQRSWIGEGRFSALISRWGQPSLRNLWIRARASCSSTGPFTVFRPPRRLRCNACLGRAKMFRTPIRLFDDRTIGTNGA